MKTIISLLIVIAAFVWIAQPELTFKPFSLKFNAIWNAVGCLLLIIALSCMQHHSNKLAEKKGYKKGHDEAIQTINTLLKEHHLKASEKQNLN